MAERTDVLVIGAGPNGLAIAAHLAQAGVDHRILGRVMGTWSDHMPTGMILKSEPYASSICAPTAGYEIADFSAGTTRFYRERGKPVSRADLVSYGTWFAERLVAHVEPDEVTLLERATDGYRAVTASGRRIAAAQVVVATGVIPFAYTPPELRHLPSELASHTSGNVDLDGMAGSRVMVLGAGQSALESAALLHEAGAEVTVVSRAGSVYWNAATPVARTLKRRMGMPVSRLCEGWTCWAYDRLPDVFRRFPAQVRLEHGLGFLGPSGAAWLRGRIEGKVPIMTSHTLVSVERCGRGVAVRLADPDRVVQERRFDFVLAGTGFRPDVSRLAFLDRSLQAGLRCVGGIPVLNRHLESSVDGLYFTGALAAPSLGPVMRFLAGTYPTAPRVTRGVRRHRRVDAAFVPARFLPAEETAGAA